MCYPLFGATVSSAVGKQRTKSWNHSKLTLLQNFWNSSIQIAHGNLRKFYTWYRHPRPAWGQLWLLSMILKDHDSTEPIVLHAFSLYLLLRKQREDLKSKVVFRSYCTFGMQSFVFVEIERRSIRVYNPAKKLTVYLPMLNKMFDSSSNDEQLETIYTDLFEVDSNLCQDSKRC